MSVASVQPPSPLPAIAVWTSPCRILEPSPTPASTAMMIAAPLILRLPAVSAIPD